jgi:peptide/nickel transport system permease protein
MRRLNPSLVVGGVIVGLIVVMALVSFVWTPYDATLVDPTVRLAKPSWEHWFGTDKFGRDVFSQIMVGSRTTLFVGVVAVGVAARRWPSELIMRTNDLLLAFPALLLAIMFGAVFGASTMTAMIAIGIATVPSFARVIRSGALQVMRTEYVLAARAAGRQPFPIALRHVLPNVTSLITVQASVSFAIAVLAEAALSFLGYGTPPPTPSWGRMLQESQEFLFSAPRLAIFPGVAIAIAVLGFNLLGDGLRDRFDPKLEDRR